MEKISHLQVKPGSSPLFEKFHVQLEKLFEINNAQYKVAKNLEISSSAGHKIIQRFRGSGGDL